ncbi:hypothetical protein [Lentilactobacillus farraginis]|uniref:hypothetical protein n=1 Tax=Lentilactobacillus farraginis TaxID=390841 RepID=UPI000552408F|nr:hypothetical protein [Lentilactobacillus farraginis]
MSEKEEVLHNFLQNFKDEDKPQVLADMETEVNIGAQVASLLKDNNLTYEEAYGSLQYAYDLLRYESNFLKLPDEEVN